jgi:hypothetical protein
VDTDSYGAEARMEIGYSRNLTSITALLCCGFVPGGLSDNFRAGRNLWPEVAAASR